MGKFKATEEKNARLDVRIAQSLRDRLENYCKHTRSTLSDTVDRAVREFLDREEKLSD